MLNLTNVVYQHGGKTLVDLDQLTVPAGQFHALLGPNGAGKTTLLRCISGDLKACGTVQLYGRDLGHWPDRERARHLAVLPQSSQLSFAFTASEVVALGLIPLTLDRATATRQVEETMTLTGCEHLARRPWPALSGGERQRVQLARVLLQLSQAERPPLLLLDEPTSAQDLGHQHGLLQLARDLCHRRGLAVLAVLHDLNQALRYCDECHLLHQGRRILSGPPQSALTETVVERYWQYRPERVTQAGGQVLLF